MPEGEKKENKGTMVRSFPLVLVLKRQGEGPWKRMGMGHCLGEKEAEQQSVLSTDSGAGCLLWDPTCP